MNTEKLIRQMGERAVTASRELVKTSSRRKNAALEAMADALDARREEIQAANRKDMDEGRAAGLTPAILDRLELTDDRLEAMTRALRSIVSLKDPVGARISRWIRPNGLIIQKVRVPIGVIAIIYESRPNVTCDAASLCIKTSNAVILRGGKEAQHSNRILADIMREVGKERGLPEDTIQLVPVADREAVTHLVQLEGLVDLAIPRGGEGLIRAVVEAARESLDNGGVEVAVQLIEKPAFYN